MVFEFEYFWAILLLFVMERICCLQEQFDKDYTLLSDPQDSNMSLLSDIDDFANQDLNLKLSFLRLYRMMHITIILTVIFFCNVCLWFIMANKVGSRNLQYQLTLTLPSSYGLI